MHADSRAYRRPLVSLIFLVIGRTKRLEEALAAARAQTYTPLEIILVDLNGNADIAALAQHDPPVRVLPDLPHNPVAAQQMAVQQSKGAYILFLSPEDVLHPASVQLAADALEADPQRAVAGCIIGEQARNPDPAALWNYALLQNCAQMPPAALFRRAAAENINAINPALRLTEDNRLFNCLTQHHAVSCVLLPGSQPASSTTDAPGAPQCGEALLRQAWRCLPGAALLRRWKLAWYLFKHTGASTRLLISMRHMLMQSQLPPLYAPYDRFLGYRQRKRNPLSKKYLAMLAVSQPTPPHRYYVICATQRSGSTLLGELLNRSDVAGKPFELFNMRNPRFPWHWWNRPEAVERLYQHCTSFTTPNHVCGIKVLSFQWENLRARLRARPPYRGRSPEDVFDEILWHPHYIWIRRRDKLRQAISLWRALQTQAWVSHYRPRNRPVFDTGAIDWLVQQLHNEDQQWQQFFDQRGITPMTIVYEDLITDQAGTLQRVLDYLDLPLSAASTVQNTTVQRQADAITEEWLLMYYDHRQYCTH